MSNVQKKEKKNPDTKPPDLVTTCFIKNFKIVQISSTDPEGRYIYTDQKVYIYLNKQYTITTNSKVFKKNQDTLLSIINDKIQKDFKKLKSDTTVNWCLKDFDSIPTYKMDDLEISFQNDLIQFGIDWGLRYACGSVNVLLWLSSFLKLRNI